MVFSGGVISPTINTTYRGAIGFNLIRKTSYAKAK